MSGDQLREIALSMDDDGYPGGDLIRVYAAELDDLHLFVELTVAVWFENDGGAYPAVGDRWGHMCFQLAKQLGRLDVDERDTEWDGT